MAAILQVRGVVKSDHNLNLTLPADFPEGEVEVTVRSAVSAGLTDADMQRHDLRAFIILLESLPPTTRTKAEIDRQIQEERASWE